MSDLKWQSLVVLKRSRLECTRDINILKSNLGGQEERLKWIDKYIWDATPKQMTLDEIERILGHKVILK